MDEDFVPFELAKKLKEKGFIYNKNNLLDRLCMENQINHPPISQVLKWLREEKGIHICISLGAYSDWEYEVGKIDGSEFCDAGGGYYSYEQAALVGIEYVLDNLI